MILLANNSTRLEIAIGNQNQLKHLEIFESVNSWTLLCLAIYFEESGRSDVVLKPDLVVLYTVWSVVKTV